MEDGFELPMQLSENGEDAEQELPEECAESEKAIEQLSERSENEKYSFINVIVLSIVLIACAVYFIAMTSTKRYGDEGNKFSFERLANGKYTAEISKRYYNSIAYPEGIKDLAAKLSSLYGITEGGSEEALLPEETKTEQLPQVTETTPPKGGHEEKEVTTADKDDKDDNGKKTKASDTSAVKYDTVFVHSTTYDPYAEEDDDSEEESVTTTNNDPPDVSATTTGRQTEVTHITTPEATESRTARPTETRRSETDVTPDSSLPEIPPSEPDSSVPENSSEPEPSSESSSEQQGGEPDSSGSDDAQPDQPAAEP